MILNLIVYLFILLISSVRADLESIEGDDFDICQVNQETLFVSLGSYCAPASLARSCGYRKAAFPFDWNICLDGEKLIEILDEDFAHFLNEDYLVPFGWATLMHTRYHLEFVHDGSWDAENASLYLPLLQAKYKRRIERFKNLKNHRGKVIFIRAAYIYSTEDMHRFYKIKENIEISEEYALKLYETIKKYFPKLYFSLIIINNHEHQCIIEEKKLHDSLLMIRAFYAYETPIMQEAYKTFFKQLM